jgi:glucose/arabinose dehydrogenase
MKKTGVLAGLLLTCLAPLAHAAQLPTGFHETVVVDHLTEPTGMAFGPSGELWVIGKRGHIYLVQNGNPLQVAHLDVASSGEEGIEGIAVDPDYATNQYIWVHYTRPLPHPERNVLSRFRHVGDQLVEEKVMLEGPPVANDIHNGGCLRFAADGTLFMSEGEDNQASKAQDKTNIRGKILHLNRDGSPVADNPFLHTGGNKFVWAYGFRNPWRFDIQPGTGQLFIGDVGEAKFEEIDIGVKGGNFGWPNVEGPMPPNQHGYIYPLYWYAHPSDAARGSAITGGDHVRGTNFPASYQGSYFFGDSVRDFIKRLELDSHNKVVAVHDFATKIPRVVDIEFGPDGALYYVGYDDGEVRRIAYDPSDNQAEAVVSASMAEGEAPLTVAFDGSASRSAEGRPPSFAWDFGDGATASAEAVRHTYPPGVYVAQLAVPDGKGGETRSDDVRIVSGNTRPRAEITTSAAGGLFKVGELIHFAGKGVDPEEGIVPCEQFRWSVVFHGANRVEPILGPTQGSCEGSFVAQAGPDTGQGSFEIRLTVSDTGAPLGALGVLEGSQAVVVRPVAR